MSLKNRYLVFLAQRIQFEGYINVSNAKERERSKSNQRF